MKKNKYKDIEAEILRLRYRIVKLDYRLLEQIINRGLYRVSKRKQFSELTDREVEILQLLAYGLNNPMIAKKLSISRSTVETHRKSLNRKLNIKSYSTLMKYALAFDLVKF